MSSPESEIRLIVLEILELLIDRRNYADKFRKIRLVNSSKRIFSFRINSNFRIPRDISQLGLPNETKTPRPFDILFMKKVKILHYSIYEIKLLSF